MPKRVPAPEPLETVRRFVNSHDLESGEDALGSPEEAARLLAEWGLAPQGTRLTARDVTRLRRLREALRAVLLAHQGTEAVPADSLAVLDLEAGRGELAARFAADGSVAVIGRGGGVDGAVAALLAIVVGAVADGSWGRLKACRADDCHWAFYDASRNHSGQWCVMEVCGNRSKARAYRARRREEPA